MKFNVTDFEFDFEDENPSDLYESGSSNKSSNNVSKTNSETSQNKVQVEDESNVMK